jgi:hypothetical protein
LPAGSGKGVGADPSASGATRVAGTANHKGKYEPDLPKVRILDATPGRIMTPAELDPLGVLAPPEPAAPAVLPLKTSRKHTRSEGEGQWPDYQRCVVGAPPAKEGDGQDRSRADFFLVHDGRATRLEHRGNRKQAA